MKLINDYLNAYTGKLWVTNGRDGVVKKIKLDKNEFDNALRLIRDGNLNPYTTFKTVKAEI